MNTLRYLTYFILLVVFLIGHAGAQNIVNPVSGYKKLPRSPERPQPDSVKSLDVLFEQLPRFGETTPIQITYYSPFDSEAGIEISAQNANQTTKIVSPLVAAIPGPVKKGDTIEARFDFTPRTVGYLDLKFVAYDPTNKDVKAPVRVGGWIMTEMVLAPSGETAALGGTAAKGMNHTVLGPYPELLSKGLVFELDPKPPVELRPPDYDKYVEKHGSRYWYDVCLEVFSGSVPGSLDLRGTVSPYHAFEAGIGIEVQHSDKMEVARITPSIEGPVTDYGAYGFEIEVRSKGQSVLESLSICFVTPNPDTLGTYARPKLRELKRCIPLLIGYDESGNLSFVTDRDPRSFMERQGENQTPLFNDRRITRVMESERPPRTNTKTRSENFDAVTAIGKTEQ